MKLILTEKQFKNLIEILTEEENPSVAGFNPAAIKGIETLAGLYNNPLQTIIDKLPPETLKSIMAQWGVDTNNLSTTNNISATNNGKFIHPLGNAQTYAVGSKYQSVRSTGTHKGVDIPAKSGTPVYAPLGGQILRAGDAGGRCGGFVKIQHEGYITKYCHLSKWTVNQGQTVKQGEVIGYVGGGMNDPYKGSSTGSHLHYEILTAANEPVNPQQSQFGIT